MTSLPPRKAKLARPKKDPRDHPKHRKWVRGFACSVPGCTNGHIEAAHARLGLPAGEQGGSSQKPGDWWCLSLCAAHHAEQHAIGERTFSWQHGINMVEIAREFASRSPHRKELEDARQELLARRGLAA